jgi:hypothetical protein
MYVRFRATARRLQVSLAETARIAGRVHYNHIASLGSIPNGRSLADRIAFWSKLHQRLATLGNRVDSTMQGAVLTAIHARIPMPNQDEQRALHIKHAREGARFWTTVNEVQAEQIAGLKSVAAKTLAEATEGEPAVALAKAKADAALDQIARAERGEDISAIGTPLTHQEMMRILGWKKSVEQLGDTDVMMAEITKRNRQNEKAVSRAVVVKALRAGRI